MLSNNTIIIAEAGVNHNGKLEYAKRLISAAKNVGADYVKFQLYDTDELVTKTAAIADYQKKKYCWEYKSQYSLLKKTFIVKKGNYKIV